MTIKERKLIMIGQDEIRHIASLAHLHIPEERMEETARELNSVLAMLDKLSDLKDDADMSAPPPVLPLARVRADGAEPSSPRDEVLANAPESYAGCFVVPKTVE